MSSDELTYLRKVSDTKTQFKELVKEFNLARALQTPTDNYDYTRQQISLDGAIEVTDDFMTFGGKKAIEKAYYLTFEPDMNKLALWHKLNAPASISLDSSVFQRNGVMNGIPVPLRGYDNGLIGSVSLATGFDGIDDWVDIPHDPRIEFDKTLEGFTFHIKFAPCNYELANGHPQTIFAKKEPATYRGYENAVMTTIHDDSSIRAKLSFNGDDYTAVAFDFLKEKETRCGITKWYDLTLKFDRIKNRLTLLLDNVVYRQEWDNPHVTPFPFHDINWHIGRSTYTNRGLFWGGLGDFRYYYDLHFTSQHNDNLFTNRLTISNIPYGHAAVIGHSYIRNAVDIGYIAGFELPKSTGEGFIPGHFLFASKPVDNDLAITYEIQTLPKVENDLVITYDIEYVYPVSNDLQIVYDIENGTDTEGKVTNDLVISYGIGTGSTNPPNQCPDNYVWDATSQLCQPVGGGGGGSHGGMDSLGLQWYCATGQQDMIPQSRPDPGDERWSRNYSNLDGGYEVIVYGVFEGTSGGHLAFKIAGGNHSGDCYEVTYDGATGCGSWYDLGFHMDRSWNIQVERIHGGQHDWDWTPSALQLPQLPIETEGATLGLRILYFPILEHGSTNNGGIRLMMWVDVSGYLNGKPQNKWQLVFDELDTGQVMREPYLPPVDQEVEMRNSDTDTQTIYGGGVHMRRINRATDLPIGSGGGGIPPTCPNGYHFDTAQQRCIQDNTVPTCPSGQHYDTNLQQCVPNPISTGTGIIGVISDTDCVSVSTTIYRRLATENVKQIIHSGDMVHENDTGCYFDALESALSADVITSMMVTLGNHNHPNEDGSQSVLDELAAYHNLSSSTNYCKAKQFGNVYIIAMNTQDGSMDSTSGVQYLFVKAELEKASSLRSQGLIDWIFIDMHKPFYTPSNTHHPDDEEGAKNLYQALFDQHQVDFVCGGHNHYMACSEPIKSGGTVLGTKTGNVYDFKQSHGQIYLGTSSGRGHYTCDATTLFPFANDSDYGYCLFTPNNTGKSFLVQFKTSSGSVLYEITVNR